MYVYYHFTVRSPGYRKTTFVNFHNIHSVCSLPRLTLISAQQPAHRRTSKTARRVRLLKNFEDKVAVDVPPAEQPGFRQILTEFVFGAEPFKLRLFYGTLLDTLPADVLRRRRRFDL